MVTTTTTTMTTMTMMIATAMITITMSETISDIVSVDAKVDRFHVKSLFYISPYLC